MGSLGSLGEFGQVGDLDLGSQTTLAIDAALAGQGAALASRFLVAADLKAGRLVQVVGQELSEQGDFFLLARRGTNRSDAVETTCRWLIEASEP